MPPMPIRHLLSAVAALALLQGCQTPPANQGLVPSRDARAAIEAAHARLVKAYNACDADAFVGAYAGAFTFVTSSTRAALTSPTGLRAWLAPGCAATPYPALELRGQALTVDGDVAVLNGQYLFRIPSGATRIDVPQHFTMALRRVGNDWRVFAHHLSIVPPAAR
jgi:ketosteroid isomerase-like protein